MDTKDKLLSLTGIIIFCISTLCWFVLGVVNLNIICDTDLIPSYWLFVGCFINLVLIVFWLSDLILIYIKYRPNIHVFRLSCTFIILLAIIRFLWAMASFIIYSLYNGLDCVPRYSQMSRTMLAYAGFEFLSSLFISPILIVTLRASLVSPDVNEENIPIKSSI